MLSGEKLQFLRVTHGVTQRKMAEWCGVSIRFIGMVEHNDRQPSSDVYNSMLDCIYNIGKPRKNKPNNQEQESEQS